MNRDLPKHLKWLAKCEPDKYITDQWYEGESRYVEYSRIASDGERDEEFGFVVAIHEDGEIETNLSTDDCHAIAASMGYVLDVSSHYNLRHEVIFGARYLGPPLTGSVDIVQSKSSRADYPAAFLAAIQQTVCAVIVDKHGEPK